MIDKVATLVSLKPLDETWRKTLFESVTFKAAHAPFAYVSGLFRSLLSGREKKLGAFLQNAAFGLTVLLFALIWLPQFASDKEGLAIVALIALVLSITGRLAGGEEARKPTAIDALVLLFFGAHIISACSSHYMAASIRGLAKVAVYIASYFLFTSVATTPRKRVILLGALILGAFGCSLYGLYQYKIGVAPLATWEDPTIESKGTRIYSTLGNPNLLAGYLVPLIPVSACLSIYFLIRRNFIAFLPAAAAFVVILAACVLTGSRGGFIGIGCDLALLGVVLSAWLWHKSPKSRPFIIAACVLAPICLALAVHFIPSVEQRITSIFVGREHSSNSYRMNVWIASWQMFVDNWWFGIGTGNQAFRLAYGLYMRSSFDALGTYCVPLEVAVETGVIGLLIFAVILLAFMSRAHINFWRQDAGATRWIFCAAAIAIAGMMAHGLVDTVFYRPQVHFIFWLLIAVVVAGDADNARETT